MVSNSENFLAQLREKRPEIHELVQHCASNQAVPHECAYFRKLAYTICAEANIHGYPELAIAANRLTLALAPDASPEHYVAAASMLEEICNQALNFTAPAPQLKRRRLFNRNSSPPCLLVADDDRLVREMMVHLFSHETQLLVAEDGQEALELMRERQPDLAVLDDIMPELTGLRLLEIICKSAELCTIPVIMLTSSNREQDFARAYSAGAVDYITKPFNPLALSRLVHQRLNLPAPVER